LFHGPPCVGRDMDATCHLASVLSAVASKPTGYVSDPTEQEAGPGGDPNAWALAQAGV